MPPPPRQGHLTSVCLSVCLSVAYMGPKSRTERPRKTKIGTEVAHVTRYLDTAFKANKKKSTCRGRGHIVTGKMPFLSPNQQKGKLLS